MISNIQILYQQLSALSLKRGPPSMPKQPWSRAGSVFPEIGGQRLEGVPAPVEGICSDPFVVFSQGRN